MTGLICDIDNRAHQHIVGAAVITFWRYECGMLIPHSIPITLSYPSHYIAATSSSTAPVIRTRDSISTENLTATSRVASPARSDDRPHPSVRQFTRARSIRDRLSFTTANAAVGGDIGSTSRVLQADMVRFKYTSDQRQTGVQRWRNIYRTTRYNSPTDTLSGAMTQGSHRYFASFDAPKPVPAVGPSRTESCRNSVVGCE